MKIDKIVYLDIYDKEEIGLDVFKKTKKPFKKSSSINVLTFLDQVLLQSVMESD